MRQLRYRNVLSLSLSLSLSLACSFALFLCIICFTEHPISRLQRLLYSNIAHSCGVQIMQDLYRGNEEEQDDSDDSDAPKELSPEVLFLSTVDQFVLRTQYVDLGIVHQADRRHAQGTLSRGLNP